MTIIIAFVLNHFVCYVQTPKLTFFVPFTLHCNDIKRTHYTFHCNSPIMSLTIHWRLHTIFKRPNSFDLCNSVIKIVGKQIPTPLFTFQCQIQNNNGYTNSVIEVVAYLIFWKISIVASSSRFLWSYSRSVIGLYSFIVSSYRISGCESEFPPFFEKKFGFRIRFLNRYICLPFAHPAFATVKKFNKINRNQLKNWFKFITHN